MDILELIELTQIIRYQILQMFIKVNSFYLKASKKGKHTQKLSWPPWEACNPSQLTTNIKRKLREGQHNNNTQKQANYHEGD